MFLCIGKEFIICDSIAEDEEIEKLKEFMKIITTYVSLELKKHNVDISFSSFEEDIDVFFAFAEFERDMIVERTMEGKAIAKQNPDFREGRPKKYSRKQIEHALELLESNSYKQVEDMTGISKSSTRSLRIEQSDGKFVRFLSSETSFILHEKMKISLL